jgi:lysophospholipase L1-like esterase
MSVNPRNRRSSASIVAIAMMVTAAGLVASTSTTAGSAVVKIPAGSKYVAIGSSYAAGQSIATQIGVCGRSTNNYPHLVAKALHLKLTDATCGAAVTANAINIPQGDQPPQIDAVTKGTRLVTITMGGNDVQYSPTALACGANSVTCLTATPPAQLDSEFAALPGALIALIDLVRSKAPRTKIVLVPYVRIVPPTTCPALNFSTAAGHVATNGFPYHPTAAGHVAMAHLVERALGGK